MYNGGGSGDAGAGKKAFYPIVLHMPEFFRLLFSLCSNNTHTLPEKGMVYLLYMAHIWYKDWKQL